VWETTWGWQNSLANSPQVPELWNENGSVYVYLNPKGVDLGASFKVPAYIFSDSRVLTHLIQADASSPVSARTKARGFGGRGKLSADDAVRNSPPLPGADGSGESRLYLPLPANAHGQSAPPGHKAPVRQDMERLIALRNLFAFLTGQPLVGTKAHPTLFAAFLQISNLLREFDFSNEDGTSYGEAVDLSFGFCMGQLPLGDVRHSREKTVEGLVLGERMRSWDLYNEAFTHAVGKYAAIVDMKLPLLEHVSMNTRRRMERAHLDLANRQHNVNTRLEQFDFPGLFAGVASSTSTPEYRDIRFKSWKMNFGEMRSFMLKYYKGQFGHWPPKASSKKNPFSETGLNRQVLKMLYSDLCSLYDLFVDRESITPRVIDQLIPDVTENDDPMLHALRRLMAEFDHSSPPVLPPIPFDVPKLPTMATVRETYTDMDAKAQARFDKHIQPHELQLIMVKSHNIDMDAVRTPFLTAFKEWELRAARGKTAPELIEQRIGYWIFLYVVIQSLPMLAIDAPGLRFTDGVEYFLCEPPQGNLPWVEDAGEVRKMWYQTAGGTNVELSADVVMFSVEATYHRSHCWLAAKHWEEAAHAPPGSSGTIPPPPLDDGMSPLEPPRSVFSDGGDPVASPTSLGGTPPPTASGPGPRGRSPHLGAHRPSSVIMGLEPVSFPPQALSSGARHASLPGPHAHDARRVSSAGNLQALNPHHGHHAPRRASRTREGTGDGSVRSSVSAGSGSTFDAILQSMDNQKKDKERKRSSFLPF
jgi:hypothetical protein